MHDFKLAKDERSEVRQSIIDEMRRLDLLRDANLFGAALHDVALRGANLSESDLSECDLSGAILT